MWGLRQKDPLSRSYYANVCPSTGNKTKNIKKEKNRGNGENQVLVSSKAITALVSFPFPLPISGSENARTHTHIYTHTVGKNENGILKRCSDLQTRPLCYSHLRERKQVIRAGARIGRLGKKDNLKRRS